MLIALGDTPTPDLSHPGHVWILLTLQCMSKMHPSLFLHHLPTANLNFYLENCIFPLSTTVSCCCFLLMSVEKTTSITIFQAHGITASSPSTGFPFPITHYVSHVLYLAYQYFMVVFPLESPADIHHLLVEVQVGCQWCPLPLGDHTHQQFWKSPHYLLSNL